jgi:hypothetical protein
MSQTTSFTVPEVVVTATRLVRPQSVSHYFPENYARIDHFVTFRALKFNSVTRTSTLSSDLPLVNNRIDSVRDPITIITLPMPAQLSTSYGATYDDSQPTSAINEVLSTAASNVIGGDMEQAARTLGAGLRNAAQAAGNQSLGSTVSDVLLGIQRQMGQLMQNPNAQTAAGSVGVSAAADALGSSLNNALAANLTGVARNSHKVLLFQGVNRREHRFAFSLSPRNRREAQAIQNIIKAFKFHMLPSYGLGNVPAAVGGFASGLGIQNETLSQLGGIAQNAGTTSRAFFQYPDVFEIQFNNHRQLFTIGESVLDSMTVNYHPMNYPAYVRSLETPTVASPAEITIELTFKETDIVTKEQITENGR